MDWNERRQRAAKTYREALSACPNIVLPVEAPWTGRHAYHLFVIRILDRDRDSIAQQLALKGIQTVVHYPTPVHRQDAYRELGLRQGTFPNSEEASQSILSLPFFPEISSSQIAQVAESLAGALRQ